MGGGRRRVVLSLDAAEDVERLRNRRKLIMRKVRALETGADLLGHQLRGELRRCRSMKAGKDLRIVYTIQTDDTVAVIVIDDRDDSDVYAEAERRLKLF